MVHRVRQECTVHISKARNTTFYFLLVLVAAIALVDDVIVVPVARIVLCCSMRVGYEHIEYRPKNVCIAVAVVVIC